MKKLLISVLTILTISCNDEVKLSKNLDGTWIIEKLEVTAFDNPNDFKSIENLGSIHFEHCKRRERNDNEGYCTGYYDIRIDDSTSVSDFTFITDIAPDRNTSEPTEYEWILIDCYSEDLIVNSTDLFITGSWKIEKIEEESCVLTHAYFGNEQKLFLKK